MIQIVIFNSLIHRMWFAIYTGDVYFFSRTQKRFVEVSETTSGDLLDELREYFM